MTKKGGEEMRKTVLMLGMALLFASTGLAADTIKLGGMLPLSGRWSLKTSPKRLVDLRSLT